VDIYTKIISLVENCPRGGMEDTTSLSLVNCRFDSCRGYKITNIKVTVTNRPRVAHIKLYQSKVEVIDRHMFDIYI
jgi:hypothetical protein